jgi:hypothetical protein
MAQTQRWQAIPTQLGLAEFEQFVLPHLSVGSRGPAPKLSLYKIFNYVLKILYLGCQWKELPITRMAKAIGKPTTRAFTASGGDGWITAAWMPFSRGRCRGFIRTATSIRRSFMATARQRRRKRVAIISSSAGIKR